MDSDILKTEALCWLRFGKKLPYVCTEGGRWNADVLGLGDTYVIEVEVKVSKQDLHREFVTKAAKHALYARADAGPISQAPNYLYFYVPAALEAEALALLAEKAPRAGVAVYDPSQRLDGKRTRIARRAQKLHDRPPSPRMRDVVLRRMGSELCGRYVAYREFCEHLNGVLKHVDDRVVEAVKAAQGTPDYEDEACSTPPVTS